MLIVIAPVLITLPVAARWMSLADFSCGTIQLVPDALLALLLGQTEK